ncbi:MULTISPECIES: O-methyltransferase [Arthrobacter]|uniref:O-methyltransferase n=1 Tax=Arthrobacter caoxuetaonis TaxID=2886935 RepID=A0A9X1MCX6_9MICC|nr:MULTISPECIES: O-methyltransferase [Arthrobacter]MCC3281056.1 O-methyltransferase [Arthrobacter caoxuetaonis]MCC3296692.1 O-methyltransferase [Arthrobacter caoxuetaonis]MCC9192782.1 O-methyltransferase [Arthrobacter sp. zg-Y916]USQ56483.1 O-methyltransferase [Arthrobacter caoxuetaonis]
MSAEKQTTWSYTEALPFEDEVLLRARERSHELGVAPVSTGVGAALTVLAASSKAQTVVEIGTGAGVSGVCLLRGLSRQSVLTTIDIDVDHLRAARQAYSEAGIPGNRTRTISGRAAEVLPRLTDNAYDLVFIDADKPNFAVYTDQAVRLLKPGGLLIVNGALDNGRVADPAAREPLTNTMRQVGKVIRENDELVSALLPTGDGLQLAVKLARR